MIIYFKNIKINTVMNFILNDMTLYHYRPYIVIYLEYLVLQNIPDILWSMNCNRRQNALIGVKYFTDNENDTEY